MSANKKNYCIAIVMLAISVIWTILVMKFDVQNMGVEGTPIGFASINIPFHNAIGVNWALYKLTDYLSVIPFLFVAGFAALGFIQLIKRKSLFKVDKDIIFLGCFYVIVLVFFVAFNKFIINYRPVLIEGQMEPSYPSSTTLLIIAVMSTAFLQLNNRLKNIGQKKIIFIVMAVFSLFMVVGRLVSGVHWLTDIIGGILIGTTLTMFYYAACVYVYRKV